MPPVITPMGAAASEAQPSSQQSARERAIAKIMAPPPVSQAQETPVANPSQVAPEEMTALKTPSEPVKADTTVDSESEPSKEAPKKDDEEPLSSQYAVLARKEKALRAKAQAQDAALAAREQALKVREEALSAKDTEYKSSYIQKDRLTQDPLSVLNEMGITYDQLTQAAMNPTHRDPVAQAKIDRLEARLAELEGGSKKLSQTIEDQGKQAYEQAVTQIRNDTKSLVASNPDFELIKATNSVDDVVELIEQTFKDDGKLLSVEEASQMVEEYLAEEAMKLAGLKKIQSKLNPQAPAKADTKQQAAQEQPQTMKTLTNSVGTQRQPSARERAIAAFNASKRS